MKNREIDKLRKVLGINPIRLQIVNELADENATFTELREILGLTDGNLASHLRALEKHGIVTFTKEFVGRRTRTTFSITEKGKEEFEKLRNWFYENLLEGG